MSSDSTCEELVPVVGFEAMTAVVRKTRLPSDVVGILEDRIADDPLDFPAFEELITIFRNKSKIDEARQTYESFLKVLPASVGSYILERNTG